MFHKDSKIAQDPHEEKEFDAVTIHYMEMMKRFPDVPPSLQRTLNSKIRSCSDLETNVLTPSVSNRGSPVSIYHQPEATIFNAENPIKEARLREIATQSNPVPAWREEYHQRINAMPSETSNQSKVFLLPIQHNMPYYSNSQPNPETTVSRENSQDSVRIFNGIE